MNSISIQSELHNHPTGDDVNSMANCEKVELKTSCNANVPKQDWISTFDIESTLGSRELYYYCLFDIRC